MGDSALFREALKEGQDSPGRKGPRLRMRSLPKRTATGVGEKELP